MVQSISSSTAAPTTASYSPSFYAMLPMLYIAWADGVLTPSEAQTLHDHMAENDALTASEREEIGMALDPKHPPSPAQRQLWLHLIRQHANLQQCKDRQDLMALGVSIASNAIDPNVGYAEDDKKAQALAELEQSLGIDSRDAFRHLLFDNQRPAPSTEADEATQERFDPQLLTKYLDGTHHKLRQRMRQLLRDPAFAYAPELPRPKYREKVLEWCQMLADQGLGAIGFPKKYGGSGDMAQLVVVFEMLAYHDLSLMTKYGVQFGLFGCSILFLGDEAQHDRYLTDTGSLALPGCFAMTETGHGSNVRELETTATYDKSGDCFIVHTPTPAGQKDYIGNAACHGQLASVFAQLEIDGEQHGVHAFLVPIRDKQGQILPGVTIEDCGPKLGLNGVDNGRISFDQVRIPRENLLGRYAQVDEDGQYQSPIADASKRFFTMLGTLVGGRVSVATGALSAAKVGLTIAIRYGHERRQFGPPGEPETRILDYLTHQRRLLPLLAKSYGLHFALMDLRKRYTSRTEEDVRQIEALAAGLKAYSTWHTTETLQTCRECCGGQGYLAENRFSALKADTDVFTTFEGDNTVLLQLTAKSLLGEFKQQFQEMRFFHLISYVASRASHAVTERNPIITRLTDEIHLLDSDYHTRLFQAREDDLVSSVALRLKRRIDQGIGAYNAFLQCQDHLVSAAKAHVERLVLQHFQEGVEQCPVPALRTQLEQLYRLYALHTLESDIAWFMENGYVEPIKSRAIRKQVNRLLGEIRHHAVALADAFGVPEELIAAPIAKRQQTETPPSP